MRSIEFQVVHPSPAPRPEGSVLPDATPMEARITRGGHGLLDIVVDGIRFIELVRRAELPYVISEQRQSASEFSAEFSAESAESAEFTALIAGDYMPLSAGFGWPDRHFLGEPKGLPRGGKEGETKLLECTCGDDDCSALMARITMTSQTVTWSAFRNTFRDWDLSALGNLTFSRSQYEGSLRTAALRQRSTPAESGH